jgi:hypothetical protein
MNMLERKHGKLSDLQGWGRPYMSVSSSGRIVPFFTKDQVDDLSIVNFTGLPTFFEHCYPEGEMKIPVGAAANPKLYGVPHKGKSNPIGRVLVNDTDVVEGEIWSLFQFDKTGLTKKQELWLRHNLRAGILKGLSMCYAYDADKASLIRKYGEPPTPTALFMLKDGTWVMLLEVSVVAKPDIHGCEFGKVSAGEEGSVEVFKEVVAPLSLTLQDTMTDASSSSSSAAAAPAAAVAVSTPSSAAPVPPSTPTPPQQPPQQKPITEASKPVPMDIEPKTQQPHTAKKERSQVDDLITQHMDMLKQQQQMLQQQQQQQQAAAQQIQQPPAAQTQQTKQQQDSSEVTPFMKQVQEFMARQMEKEKAAEESAKQQKRDTAITQYMDIVEGVKREDAEAVVDGSKPETLAKIMETFKAQKASIQQQQQKQQQAATQQAAQDNKRAAGHTAPTQRQQVQQDPSLKILTPPTLSPSFLHGLAAPSSSTSLATAATAAGGAIGTGAKIQQPYATGEDATQEAQRPGIRLTEGLDLKNLSEEQKSIIMQGQKDKGGMLSDPFIMNVVLEAMRRKK